MKLLRIALKRETALPVMALVFSSTASVALVGARIIWTGNPRYALLVWNLFLAWLPLIFAMLASERYHDESRRSWGFLGLAATWLLFFPNAPYIFTDLIHLNGYFYPHFWVDLVLILLFALTGLVLGFVSLFLMQAVVQRMFGRLASWVFIAAVAGVTGFGIYVGRFLRFNSWDVFVQPLKVSQGISHWAFHPGSYPASPAFAILFATFLFLTYVMLYALTHLRVSAPATVAAPSQSLSGA